MLVLFETPAGFALFKVLDEGKLSKVDVSIYTYMIYLSVCVCVVSDSVLILFL